MWIQRKKIASVPSQQRHLHYKLSTLPENYVFTVLAKSVIDYIHDNLFTTKGGIVAMTHDSNRRAEKNVLTRIGLPSYMSQQYTNGFGSLASNMKEGKILFCQWSQDCRSHPVLEYLCKGYVCPGENNLLLDSNHQE